MRDAQQIVGIAVILIVLFVSTYCTKSESDFQRLLLAIALLVGMVIF